MNFASDNVAGAAPGVIEAILKANSGAQAAYGTDEASRRAEALVCEVFERKAHVAFVATGTGANALALSIMTPPWGAVLCHEEAHVADDECGAPEFFTNGAKLAGIPAIGGKITPESLEKALTRFMKGVAKSVQPAVLTISQATEAGTTYTLAEIAALADLAHREGLKVHLDGARLVNALVAEGASPAAMTWQAGVDVVSLGLTKVGGLACEAIVVFDEAIAVDLAYRRKRGGHVLSKGRLLGAQAQALLTDGYWLSLAAKANALASELSAGLAALDGVRLAWPTQINEVFAILPAGVDEALRREGFIYYPWSSGSVAGDVAPRPDERLVRLVTSFATEKGDIERLIAVAARASRTS